MEKVNTMSGKVKKRWKKNQLVVTPTVPKVWSYTNPLHNLWKMQKIPNSEFYFDYGINVFQWTLHKPPLHLNRNWSTFEDIVAILQTLKPVSNIYSQK